LTAPKKDDPKWKCHLKSVFADWKKSAEIETHILKNGGRVFAAKSERMPQEHAAIAAILRY
jgi:hypothetical protein